MEPRVSIITLGVKNLEKSYHFYKEGLGFPTTRKPEGGTCLALYPYEKLAEDVNDSFKVERSKFAGITIAYNARTREEVDQVLAQAKRAGAKIEKPAQNTFWGGYSGYFSDPDGYLWEVAHGAFDINPDGSLVVI